MVTGEVGNAEVELGLEGLPRLKPMGASGSQLNSLILYSEVSGCLYLKSTTKRLKY